MRKLLLIVGLMIPFVAGVVAVSADAVAQERAISSILAKLQETKRRYTPRNDVQIAQSRWVSCGFGVNCLGPDSYCCGSGYSRWCCSRLRGCTSNGCGPLR
jgi:hypothetical protein